MNDNKIYSGSFVVKAILIVMCLSVIVSLTASFMFFNSYFAESYSDCGEILAINKLIKSNYYGEYDKEKVVYEACKGLVKGLGDPYAGYFSAEDLEMLYGSISSDYVGIGVSVVEHPEGGLLVVDVVPDGPAHNAGIIADDIISYVDGNSVTEIGMDEALKIIKTGEIGTEVVLTINRDGAISDLAVLRSELYNDPVKYELIDTDIAYITISQFNLDTGDRFKETLDLVEKDKAKAIVLDLRDNPGGEAKACEEVADALLNEGIIYYSVDKNGKKNVVYSKEGSCELPLAVLINGNTASASELVTGAIKDRGRGYIIGETSFGKGIIQSIYEIGGGESALKITVAEYFTPSDNQVHGKGVEPDKVIEPDNDIVFGNPESDNQLKYAVDYLKGELFE